MCHERKGSYLFGEPKFLLILSSQQITKAVLKLKLKPITCSHQSVPQAGTLHVLPSLPSFFLNEVLSNFIQDP